MSNLRRVYDLETVERNLLNWTSVAYTQSSIPAPDVLLAMKDHPSPMSVPSNPPTEGDADSPLRPKAFLAQQKEAAKGDSTKTSVAPSPQKATARAVRQEHLASKSPTIKNKQHAYLDGHKSAKKIQWSSDGEEDGNNLPNQASISPATTTPSGKIGKRIRVLPAAASRTVNSTGARHRRPFSDAEVTNLMAGIKRFGRNWSRIMEVYAFDGRSNVDLKDKARNLARKGLLEGSFA